MFYLYRKLQCLLFRMPSIIVNFFVCVLSIHISNIILFRRIDVSHAATESTTFVYIRVETHNTQNTYSHIVCWILSRISSNTCTFCLYSSFCSISKSLKTNASFMSARIRWRLLISLHVSFSAIAATANGGDNRQEFSSKKWLHARNFLRLIARCQL